MRLRSGKIIHMADELSNVNGGSSTNDSIPVSIQQADVSSCSEGAIRTESIVVTTIQTGNPPYGLSPGYTPPVGGFAPPVCFGNGNGMNNVQNPQQHSKYSCDYNVGSTSNAANWMTVYRQQVEESHHDLVNLLTQQMTTILNPMMANHESKFERLARQVERIARIVDYDEGERHNARGNNEGLENIFQNEKQYPKLRKSSRGSPGKLLNVHIPDLAHLAEKVRQTELMKKEKEKYRNEQRSKSRPFTQKEKVAYVTMESSEEELDFETEIDLAELKKGPPYVCSLLKKLSSSEKSNDSKLKSGKKYSFDISKSNQIFDVLLKDKQLVLPEGRILLSVKDLKGKPYFKFHQATSHSTNSCVRFRDLIQEAIMEGRLKFEDGKKEMKVDVDPFEVDASCVEPCLEVNMVGISYDFDVALDDFESQVRSVYPRTGDGLLDFLVQQKINVSLCPRCNAVFDAEAAAIFEKERMKKELAHKEEQARQRQPIRRVEGSSSKIPQHDVTAPLSRSQAIGVQWIRNCQEF
ncbi:hypothetical protein Ahy_B02g061050 [Arachis hypogaea]|uniref:Uncharacterized protein n=1 Tax=Arachis hypogaea TaxID=3818 RepID=A0A445AK36_ARAHY|nr:hypothetical protein Ahy_B02g061050 [Arachis hypogaea]